MCGRYARGLFRMSVKDSIEIAIGLLNEYNKTGELSAITHADLIIHTMATKQRRLGREHETQKTQKTQKGKKKLYEEIGSRLRKHRRSAGMSQEEIGQLLGLSRLAVTGYETGRNRISIPTLYRAADILDKSIFDFLP